MCHTKHVHFYACGHVGIFTKYEHEASNTHCVDRYGFTVHGTTLCTGCAAAARQRRRTRPRDDTSRRHTSPVASTIQEETHDRVPEHLRSAPTPACHARRQHTSAAHATPVNGTPVPLQQRSPALADNDQNIASSGWFVGCEPYHAISVSSPQNGRQHGVLTDGSRGRTKRISTARTQSVLHRLTRLQAAVLRQLDPSFRAVLACGKSFFAKVRSPGKKVKVRYERHRKVKQADKQYEEQTARESRHLEDLGGVEGSSHILQRPVAVEIDETSLAEDHGYLGCTRGELRCVNDDRPSTHLELAQPTPRAERMSRTQGKRTKRTSRRSPLASTRGRTGPPVTHADVAGVGA